MDAKQESWLPVRDYEGWYEVSNLGRVASLARQTTRGKILNPQLNSKGYRQVGLSKYGHVRLHRVGALVLEAFFRVRNPGEQVCHGPGGKQDDSLANLTWGTASKNQLDRRRDGTSNQGARCAASRLTEEIVLECRRRYAEGETQAALAIEFGVSSGAMSNAIRGHTWSFLAEGIPDPDIDGRSLLSTPEMRERRREYGRLGAEKRWRG